jgi:dimethylamine monooxygenase subunit A
MAHTMFPSAPRFRPYRWGAATFQVGLQPINRGDWLIVDDDYASVMRAKRRQLTGAPERFYKTLPGSLAAQRELKRMVVAHLTQSHGKSFSLDNETLVSTIDGHSWNLGDASTEPLWQLSGIVQEDFMLLEGLDGRMTITAASNPYSSSGRLVASVGRDIHWAHEPVPTLTATLGPRIERILQSVHEDAPCARFNWQLTPLGSIFFPHDPHAANNLALKAVSAQLREDPSLAPSLLYMRVERQTLRRLPETRAVAFSIHTYSDPLATLAPDTVSCESLLKLLRSYPLERLQYNEMHTIRDAVIAWLESLPRSSQ